MLGFPVLPRTLNPRARKVRDKLASEWGDNFFKINFEDTLIVQIKSSFIFFTFCKTHSSKLRRNYKNSHVRHAGEI